MRNNFLLCLVFVCLVTNYSECKGGRGGGGGSRSSSRSSSRGGGGWFSGSRSKPSSSSSSGHSYPSSFSGLSGFGSGSNNYPKFSYPSSTGLSGSGSSSNKYPSFSYPSSIGLSGTGSSSNKYPSFSYPPSTGLSGSGSSNNKYPSFSYPSSTGLSGSGRPSNPYHSTNTYNTNNGNPYRTPGYAYGRHNTYYNPPRYYSAPQHVYVTEYRNSGSRYSDLLSGLALYNLGRSHNNIHDRYYYDDYYRRRYYSSESSYSPNNKPKDEARCILRIKQNGKIEELNIPCEIVSTFTDGSQKLSQDTVTQTVCVTNYTIVNNTLPLTTITTPVSVSVPDIFSSTTLTSKLPKHNISPAENVSTSSSDMGVTLSNSTNLFEYIVQPNTNILNTTVTPLIKPNNYTNSSLLPDKEIALNSNTTNFLNSESTSIDKISTIPSVEVNKTNVELLSITPNTIITSQITTISDTNIFTTTVTPQKESDNFSNSSLLLDNKIVLNSNTTNSLKSESTSIDNISALPSVEVNKTNVELLSTTSNTIITSQITTISDTTMFTTIVTPLRETNNFSNSSLLLDKEIALNSNGTILLNSSSTSINNISTIPSVEVNQTKIELSTQKTIITSQITTINDTNCTVTNDPLSVKGPPIEASDMECEIDIVTKESHFRNKVNCKTLLMYAKMREPKMESSSSILPSRSKLKSWISNPPWWLLMFIAV